MAENASGGSEKAQLIAEINASRSALGDSLQGFSKAIDVPVKIGRQLTSRRMRVAAGSLVAGFVASLLLGKKEPSASSSTRSSKHFAPALKRALRYIRSQARDPQAKGEEFDIVKIVESIWRSLK